MSIKVTYVPVVAAAALMAAFIGAGTASAETKTITKYLTRGGWAYGDASAKISDCEYAYVYVQGDQSTNKEGKWQTTNSAYTSIDIYNSCTGEDRYGYAFLDGAFVSPNRKLESAATEELTISQICYYVCSPETCDEVCSAADISVKATWTGLGNIARESSHYHYKSGPYNSVSKFNGISRNAEVAVELDGVPMPNSSGSLGLATSGYVEITRY